LDIDGVRARPHGERVHLVELLVALALLGLVLAATLNVLAHAQRTYTEGAARAEAQQGARHALSRLARELRQAGGGAVPPIAVAEASRVVIGAASARGGTVTWQLTAGVLRRNAGAGAQPILNGVRALAFTYLDAQARPTTSPAAIRTVVIVLTTEPEHPGAGGATSTRLTTEVHLRNG
jgi:type II secretory pathway pseudopilin PulG